MRNTANPLKHLIRLKKIHDEDLRRRGVVLNVLLIATLIVLCLAFVAVLLSFVSGAQTAPGNRLVSISAAIIFTATLYIALRQQHYLIAAYGLLGTYAIIATIMAAQWSISLPGVSLLYSIVIILAGMTLGARYALYAALLFAVAVSIIQYGIVQGTIHPNTSWYNIPPHMVDLAVYYLVFIVLGVSSWLFNRQTDQSLHRALRAEAALQREKKKLELRVAAQTHKLKLAQIEKMDQLYRFAQLGQFTTSLLHDLGNHMSTLSLDVEGLAEQYEHSQLQTRIKRRIHYIDNMVRWAYENINGSVQLKDFSVRRETNEALKVLRYNARQAQVQLQVQVDAPAGQELQLYGDPNRFRQLLANLVLNAIDAYKGAPRSAKRQVIINLSQHDTGGVTLTVQDFGVGIPAAMQEEIFQLFYSTKHEGMGFGLFVVRQIAEEHFGGTVAAASMPGDTRFTIVLRGAKHEAPGGAEREA